VAQQMKEELLYDLGCHMHLTSRRDLLHDFMPVPKAWPQSVAWGNESSSFHRGLWCRLADYPGSLEGRLGSLIIRRGLWCQLPDCQNRGSAHTHRQCVVGEERTKDVAVQ
jgi:hypothetical protein